MNWNEYVGSVVLLVKQIEEQRVSRRGNTVTRNVDRTTVLTQSQ